MFRPQIILSLILAILILTLSLEFVETRAAENEYHVGRFGKQKRSSEKVPRQCICGFASFKCCQAKKIYTVEKPHLASDEVPQRQHDSGNAVGKRNGLKIVDHQRPSRANSKCICGITSHNCCEDKRSLQMAMKYLNMWGLKNDFMDQMINQRLRRKDLQQRSLE